MGPHSTRVWGLVKIVDTITVHSMYLIAPGADFSVAGVRMRLGCSADCVQDNARQFAADFPELQFHMWCSRLGSARRFGEIKDDFVRESTFKYAHSLCSSARCA